MKNLTKLMLACGLVAGLAACNKEIDPQEDAIHKDAIWMSFKIEIPETRAAVTPGTEVGTDAENALKTVQLVLVDPNTKNVIALSETGLRRSGETYTCPFQSANLVNFASASEKKTLNVVAYCNSKYAGSVGENEKFDPDKVIGLTSGAMESEALWNSTTGFIMTNAAPASFQLPTKTELLEYNSEKHPFSIGEIQVERAAARFDIATAKKYTIFNMNDGLQISFTDLGMFNISNEQYYLRRVSADGQNTSSDLFGTETGLNYVVDTKATEKNTFVDADAPSNVADFVYASTPVEWTSIASITQADNWVDGTHQAPDVATDYCIWRYASENVLPARGAELNNQYEDLCTGVAFKGKIQATDAAPKDLKAAFDGGKTVYLFDNILYGDDTRLERAAHQGFVNGTDDTDGSFAENKRLQVAYDEVAKAATDGGKKFEQAAEESKLFTVYKAPYNVYYNYWNKHNDNNNPTESDVMEHAVVRNNVYKLRVNKIKKFGTPTFVVPAHKPIEEDNVYFEVTVSILPWTVKVNDIEF